MAINVKALSKGELRKLTALRKSLGNDIANEAFEKWLKSRPAAAAAKEDPVAAQIEEALSRYAKNKDFKLGNYGYTIRRAKGKGASGFIATRNEKPVADMAATRKSPAKTTTATKAVVKKTAVKKAPVKTTAATASTTKKAVAKKSAARKSSAKTTTARKSVARKSPAKKQRTKRLPKAA